MKNKQVLTIIGILLLLFIFWAHDLTKNLALTNIPGYIKTGEGTCPDNRCSSTDSFTCPAERCAIIGTATCTGTSITPTVSFRTNAYSCSDYKHLTSPYTWIAYNFGSGLVGLGRSSSQTCNGCSGTINIPGGATASVSTGSLKVYCENTLATFSSSGLGAGLADLTPTPLTAYLGKELLGGGQSSVSCTRNLVIDDTSKPFSCSASGQTSCAITTDSEIMDAEQTAIFQDGTISYILYSSETLDIQIQAQANFFTGNDMKFTFTVKDAAGKAIPATDIKSGTTVTLTLDGLTIPYKTLKWDATAGYHEVTFTSSKTGNLEIKVIVRKASGASDTATAQARIDNTGIQIGTNIPNEITDLKPKIWDIWTKDASGAAFSVDSVDVKICPPTGCSYAWIVQADKLTADHYQFAFEPQVTGQFYDIFITARKAGFTPGGINPRVVYSTPINPLIPSIDPIFIIGAVATALILGLPLLKRLRG